MTVFFVESYCFIFVIRSLIRTIEHCSKVLSFGNKNKKLFCFVFRSLIRTSEQSSKVLSLTIVFLLLTRHRIPVFSALVSFVGS